MHSTPPPTSNCTLTKKQFWVAAYLASLHRLGAEDARVEADKALSLCDERWRKPEYIGHWQYKHDFPVGHAFETVDGN